VTSVTSEGPQEPCCTYDLLGIVTPHPPAGISMNPLHLRRAAVLRTFFAAFPPRPKPFFFASADRTSA